METLKKVGGFLAPEAKKSDDGRDQWPSRTSFILASMCGCAGLGNLLRFPSQVYNNIGLQWFIPYLMAVFIIAIPTLILEVSIGQAYRGGCVIAFNNINQRLKGMGLGLLFIAFCIGPYFVMNLAWIMAYFRHSFASPLPWKGRTKEFFMENVVRNVSPVEAGTYVQYPGVALIGEIVGWSAFTWFLIWLCIFRGIGMTGRVVYFTMGLPIVITIVLIVVRSCGQVFFSTGVGFGYFTSYASYNQKYSNAVMDSVIIACSNALFEIFAVLGCIGFLQLFPDPNSRIGSSDIGFLTWLEAVANMPGANFWAVALFFTLMVLGFSSAFAILDSIVTLIMDAQKRFRRPIVVTGIVILSFLLTLPYFDRWINDVALVFVVWAECYTSTTIYRWKDVWGQVGKPAYFVYNGCFLLAMILGVAIGHAVQPSTGAGAGFGLFITGVVVSVLIATEPDTKAPSFWNRNVSLRKLFYLAFYSGNQLTIDLNLIVATGNNWAVPIFWAPLLPSSATSLFYAVRDDPLHIFGFATAHLVLISIILGLIVPSWFDVFIPVARQHERKIEYAPGVAGSSVSIIAGRSNG
ncbi:putative sodium/chloride dependent neurotransmitter transporter [Amylocarpus encephaloides]|uniref:Sodium/chloride dependent neurotransmitter transporter n=1 Tax=Amylocarpus encephaloides TaxID=45428 RepID=A0A9P7YRJ2_9HELO|nr:putative sodium/chloride dependent neurotransmitter transporter [Amylocarpus encephaloides]